MNLNMREVAKDINGIKITWTDTLDNIMNKFYGVMRKHGIYESEWNEDMTARTCNNFEWTMCRDMFFKKVTAFMEFGTLIDKTPKDLIAKRKN
jgi:hypothetical protein